MSSVPVLEWTPTPAAESPDVAVPAGDRSVARLGAWMAILGAVGLGIELAEYGGEVREGLSTGWIASRGWIRFVGAHPPGYVLVAAWPLLLGLALRRTGWKELVRAGALTFAILAVGGLMTAVADWSRNSTPRIAIGSFRMPKPAQGGLPASGQAMGLAGAAQLLAELATAIAAVVLASRVGRSGPVGDRGEATRRSRFGRMAMALSAVVLLPAIRLPSGSAYLELLTQSRWFREFILQDELVRLRARHRPPVRQSEWAYQARVLLDEAQAAWNEGRYAGSSESYSQLAALIDSVPPSTMNPDERQLAAQALNNWAWLLATCPEGRLRNHAEAARYARRALEMEPHEGNYWNTLGVAFFRLEAWDDALSALYRSMELRDEGDSHDWYFLAMIHRRLGHEGRAREWYDKALQWARVSEPGDDELYRFGVEAAVALGLPKPERPAPTAGRRLGPSPYSPHPMLPRRGRMGYRR